MTNHFLSARAAAAALRRGVPRRHGDGGGLYLKVSGPGRGPWVFMHKTAGRQRLLGLGSVQAVSLKAARELADACRTAVQARRDPRAALAQAAGEMTFETAARALIESMAPSWRNATHLAQWSMTLLGEMPDKDGGSKETRFNYCAAIRNKPMSQITTEDALRVLEPLWQTRPETASRLRGRCERVWDFAKARGHCAGENPFRWRGHLAALLPKRPHLSRGHHKAMPFADVPAFISRLRTMEGMAARALELAILTAARVGEMRGARWNEVDLASKVWTLPAHRMKGGREHRVPLSARAVAIAEEMQQARLSEFVFPGVRLGKPLSYTTLARVLRRMKIDVTTHGFRSSFRDWAGDSTAFPRDVVEAALAHAIENKTEAAYRRSDALEKRRKLMAAWAAYCASAPKENSRSNVTSLRA